MSGIDDLHVIESMAGGMADDIADAVLDTPNLNAQIAGLLARAALLLRDAERLAAYDLAARGLI